MPDGGARGFRQGPMRFEKTPPLPSSIRHPLPEERVSRMSGRVRGLFAGDAYMVLEVCDTRDFDGTLSWPWPGIVSSVSVCYIRYTQ